MHRLVLLAVLAACTHPAPNVVGTWRIPTGTLVLEAGGRAELITQTAGYEMDCPSGCIHMPPITVREPGIFVVLGDWLVVATASGAHAYTLERLSAATNQLVVRDADGGFTIWQRTGTLPV